MLEGAGEGAEEGEVWYVKVVYLEIEASDYPRPKK